MPSTDASALPTTARERRWSLAAAIASVTVFGLSVGQGGPLMPLLLEERGTDTTLNGLNAGAMFAAADGDTDIAAGACRQLTCVWEFPSQCPQA